MPEEDLIPPIETNGTDVIPSEIIRPGELIGTVREGLAHGTDSYIVGSLGDAAIEQHQRPTMTESNIRSAIGWGAGGSSYGQGLRFYYDNMMAMQVPLKDMPKEKDNCSHCGDDRKVAALHKNNPICKDCFKDYFFQCKGCSKVESTDYYYITHESYRICNDCFKNIYFECRECDEVWSSQYMHSDGICPDCSNQFIERNHASNLRHISTNPGKIVKSTRAWGLSKLWCWFFEYWRLEKKINISV